MTATFAPATTAQPRDRVYEWRDVRADMGDDEAAAATGDASTAGLILEGYAAVFNQWTTIEDWDGEYQEMIARGAFTKTLRERKDRVLCLYDHGHSPFMGSLPLGSFEELREDDHGLYVRVLVHDNWMTQPVRDAIASGSVHEMSFRFRPVKQTVEMVEGDVPRVTRTEVTLIELGPTPLGCFSGTEAAMRAWADAAPTELRAAFIPEAGAGATVIEGTPPTGGTADGTLVPAGSTTGDDSGAAVHDEPVRATRHQLRHLALALRGTPE